jgi:ATP-dependent HslUV protease ATP-binding subunit HslU
MKPESYPQGDRRRAGRTYHRPGRRQARRRRRAAQPLAPPAAARRTARRGDAQEHPDDRPDRLRQDRDQPPPGKAGRRPFLKVEATKFTEVGYVGRDVEQIARDLVEEAIRLEKDRRREAVREAAEAAAMERMLTPLVGRHRISEATREAFRQRIRDRHMTMMSRSRSRSPTPRVCRWKFPAWAAGRHDQPVGDMMGKAFGQNNQKRRKLKVPDAWASWSTRKPKSAGPGRRRARRAAECRDQRHRLLDEIDKIAVSDVRGGSVSREGVQRDLLPLIEGTTVATKYGPMKTDHVLFIASGAFHVAKPSATCCPNCRAACRSGSS